MLRICEEDRDVMREGEGGREGIEGGGGRRGDGLTSYSSEKR